MQYNQPYGVGDPNAAYINGNPSTGTMGSIPPAASIEYDQREIVEVINFAHLKGYVDDTGAPCAVPSNADLTQLRKAIWGISHQTVLHAPTTYYVNAATGNDGYDGSSASVVGGGVGPFATIQRAVNQAVTFLPSVYGVTVVVAAGTYAGFGNNAFAMPTVTVQGAGIGSTVITSNLNATISWAGGSNVLYLKNCSVGNTYNSGGPSQAIGAVYGGAIFIDQVELRSVTGANGYLLVSNVGGSTLHVGNVTINATCLYVMSAGAGGIIELASAVINIVALGVGAGGVFAYSWDGSLILTHGYGVSGPTAMIIGGAGLAAVTGYRYEAILNAIIDVGGTGPNTFPGSLPGAVSTGGQYA